MTHTLTTQQRTLIEHAAQILVTEGYDAFLATIASSKAKHAEKLALQRQARERAQRIRDARLR